MPDSPHCQPGRCIAAAVFIITSQLLHPLLLSISGAADDAVDTCSKGFHTVCVLHVGTLRPIPTEPLCIPDLCLAGRLPQQHNAVFNLDLSAANAVPGAAADVTAWPEFHNGVAAGQLLHLLVLPAKPICSD